MTEKLIQTSITIFRQIKDLRVIICRTLSFLSKYLFIFLILQVVIFSVEIPITKGYTCILHYGSVQVSASVKKIVGLLDKSTGEVAQNVKKPRFLTKGNNAVIEIISEVPVCLDLYTNVKELGRFMLRTGGKTIAAGMVTETY